MTWGMGLLRLLVIIVLLLATAALILAAHGFEYIQKMPRFARDLDV
jgi:hypothetical protein